MHDQHDDRIDQANAAIRDLFRKAPNGCIPAEDRPAYDELLSIWLAAVQARNKTQQDPEPLAA